MPTSVTNRSPGKPARTAAADMWTNRPPTTNAMTNASAHMLNGNTVPRTNRMTSPTMQAISGDTARDIKLAGRLLHQRETLEETLMNACLVRLLLLIPCALGGLWPAWAAEPPPVGFETREFVDATRSNWQNTGHRPLSTVIWYPAAAGSPLSVPQVGDPASRPFFVQSHVVM